MDADYSAVIRSNTPIVVQFSRMDTSQAKLALLGTIAFGDDG